VDYRSEYQTLNLEASTGKSREYTGSKDLLNRTKAAQQLRERIGKWDYVKLSSFYTRKKKGL
jgi:hypothetical protein